MNNYNYEYITTAKTVPFCL